MNLLTFIVFIGILLSELIIEISCTILKKHFDTNSKTSVESIINKTKKSPEELLNMHYSFSGQRVSYFAYRIFIVAKKSYTIFLLICLFTQVYFIALVKFILVIINFSLNLANREKFEPFNMLGTFAILIIGLLYLNQ